VRDSLLQLAAPGVRSLQPYVPGKPVEELERELGIHGAIKLASNENPLGPSPKAVEVIRGQLAELARYPDGGGFRLRDALAARHGVTPDQITIGNGSNDLLELVTRAFVTPENEVVFSQHAFAVYPIVTQAVGARAVVVPARDWGHDLDAMARAVTPRTRMVFIANPNNPTGTWLKAAPLKTFLAALPAHVIPVLDEAYFEYVSEPEYPDTTQWMKDFPQLVVTRTFSKVFGLAGLRVGYAVSQPDVADLLNRVRQPFNVNSLAQAAALVALDDREHLKRSHEMNHAGMKQLESGFRELGLSWISSVGNFVAVATPQPGRVLYQKLLREGVIVRPVDNYEMPNHLRVTVGLPDENARFLAALAKVLTA
jgi:histidinol-phosphate aminotransferase